jgi:hypothetical protein
MVKKPTSPQSKNSAKAVSELADEIQYELARFRAGTRVVDLNVDAEGETMWATQAQIAELFDKDANTIGVHIKNIYDSKELGRDATTSKFEVVRSEGGRTVKRTLEHFNLDVMISVGYRVQSPTATAFRQWATKTLRSYIVDGYAINESRLREDPAAVNKLAAKLREIRAQEKNLYANVRDFFKEASSDYDPKSPLCHSFYAKLQDTFHYAVTRNTASQLILERADHSRPNMGLQNFEGNLPTIDEVKIGKNYLDHDELYIMHILCEQFLLYVESRAVRGQSMTMKDLSGKLHALLALNDYPVFPGYKDYIKDKAVKHAVAEYARFLTHLKNDDVRKIDKKMTPQQ